MGQDTGFATRLENGFLGILRVFILLVLAISLVAAAFFAFTGVSQLGAKPETYTYAPFDGEAVAQRLKEEFSEKKPDLDAPSADKPKAATKENSALEAELSKQVAVVQAFLKRADRFLTDPERFKSARRSEAKTLAFDKSDEGIVKYAAGQSAFFAFIFKHPDLLAMEKKAREEGSETFLRLFFERAVGVYPEFHREQAQAKQRFDAEQAMLVAEAKAGAMMQFYIAAGFFGAFLLISLILVLVKIERDLRFRA